MAEWLNKMEDGFKGKKRGFILTFNISDYVYLPGRPLCRLKTLLSQYLKVEQRYDFVVHFSRAKGCELYYGSSDKNKSQKMRNDFEQYSGLHLQNGAGSEHCQVQQPGREAAPQLKAILSGLTKLLRQNRIKVALIIDYAHHLAPAQLGMPFPPPEEITAIETIHSWGIDDSIRSTDNRIVLLALEGYINESLKDEGSGYKLIRVDLPNEEERKRFCSLLIGKQGNEFARLDENLSLEVLARLTSGLRYTDLEDLFRSASVRGCNVDKEMVRKLKAEVIRKMCQELLEVLEPSCGFDGISGLQHIIRYLVALNHRLQQGYLKDFPRAILFVGIPGVGKTFLVKAWAQELGYNCVAMRNIRSMWVGESERNLERVFNCLVALQPCLVFIDEIDQALGKRGQGGDSGTSERMLARIWEFTAFEEYRGRIIWIGASNRPDMLDPATLDRFGVVLPFLHPTRREILGLFPVLARQLKKELLPDVNLEEIVNLPSLRYVTSRGLLEVISMAGLYSEDNKITHKALLQAARAYKPNFNPIQHEFIALTAIRMTSFTTFYPWMDEEGNRDPEVEIPEYLEGLVDNNTGVVMDDKLNRRLDELSERFQFDLGRRGF